MDLSKVKVNGHRLLVRLDPIKEKQTQGGVWLPEKHGGEWSRTGEIIALGDDVDKERYKVGDKIFADWHSGVVISDMVTHRDDTVRIITPEDVLGWLEE